MVVIPRYEPVFVEPNLKEYETQVLQMSMAIDDHDSTDLKIDFSARNHVFDPAFNLDSVSYITHETSTSKLPYNDNDISILLAKLSILDVYVDVSLLRCESYQRCRAASESLDFQGGHCHRYWGKEHNSLEEAKNIE